METLTPHGLKLAEDVGTRASVAFPEWADGGRSHAPNQIISDGRDSD